MHLSKHLSKHLSSHVSSHVWLITCLPRRPSVCWKMVAVSAWPPATAPSRRWLPPAAWTVKCCLGASQVSRWGLGVEYVAPYLGRMEDNRKAWCSEDLGVCLLMFWVPQLRLGPFNNEWEAIPLEVTLPSSIEENAQVVVISFSKVWTMTSSMHTMFRPWFPKKSIQPFWFVEVPFCLVHQTLGTSSLQSALCFFPLNSYLQT